jgi:hypothetical protein
MIQERHRAFLIDFLRTDQIPHLTATLFDHLVGTYSLLQAWRNPQEICLAGLFHSIYGTAHFRRASLPFSQRRLVQNIIGREAEYLAYLFCVTDRPHGLLGQWKRNDIVVRDRYIQDLVVLNRRELLDLLEIEAANLLDQKANGHSAVAELVQLPLSEGAREALSCQGRLVQTA